MNSESRALLDAPGVAGCVVVVELHGSTGKAASFRAKLSLSNLNPSACGCGRPALEARRSARHLDGFEPFFSRLHTVIPTAVALRVAIGAHDSSTR
jgi:hypothetical protein